MTLISVGKIEEQAIAGEILSGFTWLWSESWYIFEGLLDSSIISGIYRMHDKLLENYDILDIENGIVNSSIMNTCID